LLFRAVVSKFWETAANCNLGLLQASIERLLQLAI